MKTRFIYYNPVIGMTFKDQDLDLVNYQNLKKEVINSIKNTFNWNNHEDIYTHLVISIEDNDMRYVYENGLLMTDDKFNRVLLQNPVSVYAIHRKQ